MLWDEPKENKELEKNLINLTVKEVSPCPPPHVPPPGSLPLCMYYNYLQIIILLKARKFKLRRKQEPNACGRQLEGC